MRFFKASFQILALALTELAAAGLIREVAVDRSSRSTGLNKREIPLAEHSIEIAAKVSLGSSKRKRDGYSSKLAGVDDDAAYVVNVTLGKDQVFPVIVDTGSSDLWVAQVGFQCFNLSNVLQPDPACGFGNIYDPSKSSSFTPYPDHNFNISYASSQFLTGNVGFETVTIAGLTVEKQEFGLVNQAGWAGTGNTLISGILGLAAPSVTSVYKGTNLSADVEGESEIYNPFFYNAVQKGLVRHPYFSIALNRGTTRQYLNSTFNPGLGTIAFGGRASVPTLPISATTPILNFTGSQKGPVGKTFYIVNVDEYRFPGSSELSTSSNVTVLDSGTTFNYLPTDIVSTYAAAFNPPAYADSDIGGYVAVCKSKVPEFEVVIGGVAFSIAAADQLIPIGIQDASGNDICFLGIQDGATIENGKLFILGSMFLHNVVATFNIVENEVTLAQRVPY